MASTGACQLIANSNNSYKFDLVHSNHICYYLKTFVPHIGHQKGLPWFKPSWQLRTTQPLADSSLSFAAG